MSSVSGQQAEFQGQNGSIRLHHAIWSAIWGDYREFERGPAYSSCRREGGSDSHLHCFLRRVLQYKMAGNIVCDLCLLLGALFERLFHFTPIFAVFTSRLRSSQR